MGDGPIENPQPTTLPEMPSSGSDATQPMQARNTNAFDGDKVQPITPIELPPTEDPTVPDRRDLSNQTVLTVVKDTPEARDAIKKRLDESGATTISMTPVIPESKLSQAFGAKPITPSPLPVDRNKTQPVITGTTMVYPSASSHRDPVPATDPDALAYQVDRIMEDHRESGGTTVMRVIRNAILRAAHRNAPSPIDRTRREK